MTGPDEKTIIEAAGRNDVASLRALTAKQRDLNFHALDGLTPLINASRHGANDAVRFLLAQGADPNYLGDSVTSAAYWAAVNCHAEAFDLITIAGGKIRLPDFAKAGFADRLALCKDAAFVRRIQERVASEDRSTVQ